MNPNPFINGIKAISYHRALASVLAVASLAVKSGLFDKIRLLNTLIFSFAQTY